MTSGKLRWRQAFTPDRKEPKLSIGVQGNLLLKGDTLYVNGGAPAGIIALDARTGENPRIVLDNHAGMEMFLQPDDQPLSIGPELFSHENGVNATVLQGQEGRVFFQASGWHIALVGGRVFGSRDPKKLDVILRM